MVTVFVAAPKAAADVMIKDPSLMLILPPNVLVADKVSLLFPFLVRL